MSSTCQYCCGIFETEEDLGHIVNLDIECHGYININIAKKKSEEDIFTGTSNPSHSPLPPSTKRKVTRNNTKKKKVAERRPSDRNRRKTERLKQY